MFDIKTGSIVGLKTRISDLEALFLKEGKDSGEAQVEKLATHATMFCFKSIVTKFYAPICVMLTDSTIDKTDVAYTIQSLYMSLNRVGVLSSGIAAIGLSRLFFMQGGPDGFSSDC